MVVETGFGKQNYKILLMKPVLKLVYVIFLLEHLNGIRLSIECSVRFQRIGGVDRLKGRPLESLMVIVNLIAATTTKNGLSIQCQLDLNQYPKGIRISDDELASVNIIGDDFHPNWNYTILPQSTE